MISAPPRLFLRLGGMGKLVCPCGMSEPTGELTLAYATQASSG